jgi:hypothetical protein
MNVISAVVPLKLTSVNDVPLSRNRKRRWFVVGEAATRKIKRTWMKSEDVPECTHRAVLVRRYAFDPATPSTPLLTSAEGSPDEVRPDVLWSPVACVPNAVRVLAAPE